MTTDATFRGGRGMLPYSIAELSRQAYLIDSANPPKHLYRLGVRPSVHIVHASVDERGRVPTAPWRLYLPSCE